MQPINRNKRPDEACHGHIASEKRGEVHICYGSEPSESNNYTNYAPIPEEEDNVQLHNVENVSDRCLL